MTLVLSMNPFLDPEGDPPLSTYQPIWESERCTKACLTSPAPPCSSDEQFTRGTDTKDNLFVYSIDFSLI